MDTYHNFVNTLKNVDSKKTRKDLRPRSALNQTGAKEAVADIVTDEKLIATEDYAAERVGQFILHDYSVIPKNVKDYAVSKNVDSKITRKDFRPRSAFNQAIIKEHVLDIGTYKKLETPSESSAERAGQIIADHSVEPKKVKTVAASKNLESKTTRKDFRSRSILNDNQTATNEQVTDVKLEALKVSAPERTDKVITDHSIEPKKVKPVAASKNLESKTTRKDLRSRSVLNDNQAVTNEKVTDVVTDVKLGAPNESAAERAGQVIPDHSVESKKVKAVAVSKNLESKTTRKDLRSRSLLNDNQAVTNEKVTDVITDVKSEVHNESAAERAAGQVIADHIVEPKKVKPVAASKNLESKTTRNDLRLRSVLNDNQAVTNEKVTDVVTDVKSEAPSESAAERAGQVIADHIVEPKKVKAVAVSKNLESKTTRKDLRSRSVLNDNQAVVTNEKVTDVVTDVKSEAPSESAAERAGQVIADHIVEPKKVKAVAVSKNLESKTTRKDLRSRSVLNDNQAVTNEKVTDVVSDVKSEAPSESAADRVGQVTADHSVELKKVKTVAASKNLESKTTRKDLRSRSVLNDNQTNEQVTDVVTDEKLETPIESAAKRAGQVTANHSVEPKKVKTVAASKHLESKTTRKDLRARSVLNDNQTNDQVTNVVIDIKLVAANESPTEQTGQVIDDNSVGPRKGTTDEASKNVDSRTTRQDLKVKSELNDNQTVAKEQVGNEKLHAPDESSQVIADHSVESKNVKTLAASKNIESKTTRQELKVKPELSDHQTVTKEQVAEVVTKEKLDTPSESAAKQLDEVIAELKKVKTDSVSKNVNSKTTRKGSKLKSALNDTLTVAKKQGSDVDKKLHVAEQAGNDILEHSVEPKRVKTDKRKRTSKTSDKDSSTVSRGILRTSKPSKKKPVTKVINFKTPKILPVPQMFPDGLFPLGQEMKYAKSRDDRTAMDRFTSIEARVLDKIFNDNCNDARRAAEAHRQTRKFIQKWVKPGIEMITLSEKIETGARYLVGEDGLKAGLAFPAGCSRNNCAAHYTPNPGDRTVLKYDDVTKIDFGVHVNGHIIDCAWTLAFNPRYDKLIEAVREATNAGIRAAGIDVRLGDIGSAIQEVMESYEVELNGKLYSVKPIRNLNGHSIKPYRIHGGKIVPVVRSSASESSIMEENEFYAIESLGSTGYGVVRKGADISHYMKRFEAVEPPVLLSWSRKLLSTINKNFGTLAFCKRWLEDIGLTRYRIGLNELSDANIITAHPPLYDLPGSYSAQFEHTIVLRPTCKEVLSRGPDY